MFELLESRRMFSSSLYEPMPFEPDLRAIPETSITLRRTFVSKCDITRDLPDIWTAPNDDAAVFADSSASAG